MLETRCPVSALRAASLSAAPSGRTTRSAWSMRLWSPSMLSILKLGAIIPWKSIHIAQRESVEHWCFLLLKSHRLEWPRWSDISQPDSEWKGSGQVGYPWPFRRRGTHPCQSWGSFLRVGVGKLSCFLLRRWRFKAWCEPGRSFRDVLWGKLCFRDRFRCCLSLWIGRSVMGDLPITTSSLTPHNGRILPSVMVPLWS